MKTIFIHDENYVKFKTPFNWFEIQYMKLTKW